MRPYKSIANLRIECTGPLRVETQFAHIHRVRKLGDYWQSSEPGLKETDLDPASTVSVWRRLPSFVKAILVLQLGLIVYLATWMYMEYQNNQYLQAYVLNSLQTSMPALQIALPVFLATGTIAVYGNYWLARRGLQRNIPGKNSSLDLQEYQPQSLPIPRKSMGRNLSETLCRN